MYAPKVDLELRYGVPEVAQLERGLTESQSINTALDDASQIADGYICAYYTVLHWKVHRKISRFMYVILLDTYSENASGSVSVK